MSTPEGGTELRAIGRYRLERRLGAGGFAVVWLAHDTVLDAQVAVKIMAENWAERTDLRERFLREAQMLRQASSRRVVQVFDIGELPDGRPYFVMEYADRGTLDERIQASPLALDEALRTTAEVAVAVAELHDAGVVHRDVKPSNVLIASDRSGSERLVLADLGVAKNLAQASRLTMSVGSAGYQAPEQAEPNLDVDVRADVYSLGALGYRLVTGHTPAAPGKVLPPRHFRANLPSAIADALMGALALDPDDRPASARAFAATLEELSTHQPDSYMDGGSHLPAGPAGQPAVTSARGEGRGVGADEETRPVAAGAEQSLLPQAVRESPFPAQATPRRPRKRWLVRGFVLVLVLALAGAGGGVVFLHQQDGRWPWEQAQPPTVALQDVTKHITLRVPRAWANEAVPGGWNPDSIGLPDTTQPGLLVATSRTNWGDLTQDVDGVFAGFSDDDGLGKAVTAIKHTGCTAETRRAYSDTRWQGEVQRWSSCEGGSRSVAEVLLTPAGTTAPRLYVQIRQSAGAPDETNTVLSGLRLQ